MLRMKVWLLSLVMCCLVLSSAEAGYLLKRTIHKLTAGDEFLELREGEVCLTNKSQEDTLLRWSISAPTLLAIDRTHSFNDKFYKIGRLNRNAKYEGKFLCLDDSTETPRLKLAEKNDGGCTWAFDFLSTQGPREERIASDYNGFSSHKFRLKVGNGKHEGQFIAAESLSEEQKAAAEKGEVVVRRLVLTKDARQALVFDYVEAEFRGGGK